MPRTIRDLLVHAILPFLSLEHGPERLRVSRRKLSRILGTHCGHLCPFFSDFTIRLQSRTPVDLAPSTDSRPGKDTDIPTLTR